MTSARVRLVVETAPSGASVGSLLLVIMLLAGLLDALVVAPWWIEEATPGVGLTRWVAITHMVVASGAPLYRLAEMAITPSLGVEMPASEFLAGAAGERGP